MNGRGGRKVHLLPPSFSLLWSVIFNPLPGRRNLHTKSPPRNFHRSDRNPLSYLRSTMRSNKYPPLRRPLPFLEWFTFVEVSPLHFQRGVNSSTLSKKRRPMIGFFGFQRDLLSLSLSLEWKKGGRPRVWPSLGGRIFLYSLLDLPANCFAYSQRLLLLFSPSVNIFFFRFLWLVCFMVCAYVW